MPVSEYDEERESDLKRAQKRQMLNKLFPNQVTSETEKSNLGLLGNRLNN